MDKKGKKLIKKIFWTISLVLVLIVVTGISLAYVYEAEVKQYAIAKINEQTNSKIKVEKIELSFLKRFPQAALQFHNIEIMEVVKAGEPSSLIKAKDVFLKFSVIDLIQSKIILKDVEIDNAKLNLVVFEDGSDNFHIFKEREEQKSDFLLELFQVSLHNFVVQYHNYATKQDLDLEIKKVSLKGNFGDTDFNIRFQGNTTIRKYSSEGYKMLENKSLSLDFDVVKDMKTTVFQLRKGNINYNNIPFSITGNIEKPADGVFLDLKLSASSLSLVQLINTVPESYKSRLKDYKYQGIIAIDASIKGLVVSHSVPYIKIAISLNDAEIESIPFDAKLSKLRLKAYYTNGKHHSLSSSSLHIEDFGFSMGASSFEGKFLLSNFVKSKLQMELNSSVDLGELIKFTGKLYGIQKLEGRANINFKIAGKVKGLVGKEELSFNSIGYSATVKMMGSSFQHESSDMYYKDIVGSLWLDENAIHIAPSKVVINGHSVQLSGDVSNYYSWIKDSKNQKLIIRAKVNADYLGYSDILQITDNHKDGDGTFPNDIDMFLSFKADTFVWDKLMAQNATGDFRLSNQILSFHNLKFQIFDGSMSGELSINGSQVKSHSLFCEGRANNVNITQLFRGFDNFNQQTITDQNLKGILSAKFTLNASFDSKWKTNSKAIMLESNVIIKNGELNNIKELNALSNYTRIDDFSHIVFSTLENTIQIKNGNILIPDMLVKSNKMDIDLAGTHNFDNVYDYHIGVLMSDVLYKKAKSKSQNEFGEVQSDGYGRTKLFFHVYGKGDDLSVKYDNKNMAKKLKKDMAEEGKDLKTVLNKEFGWFKKSQEDSKKDSLIIEKKKKEKEQLKKQEEGEFIFEWDEGEEESTEPPLVM